MYRNNYTVIYPPINRHISAASEGIRPIALTLQLLRPIMMSRLDIKQQSAEQIAMFLAEHGEKKFRAAQIHDWIWKKNVSSFDEMSNISAATRELLSANFTFLQIQLVAKQESGDGTIKFGFSLQSGQMVEGVLIPSGDRTTACISSQAGCNVGCTFCATAKLGFLRNLTAAEIYEQVFIINQYSEQIHGHKLSNIVYMGMGEPLLNYTNVLKSIDLVTTDKGLEMSPKRITVSTSGIARGIRRLADDGVKFNLALSLHAATDKKRTELMPINEVTDLAEIIESISYFVQKTGSRPTFEYLMLGGFNDTIDDARALALFCRNFPSKVNLIEYNPVEGDSFKRSDPADIDAFVRYLESKNMLVHVRRSRGKDIDAACGQLANKNK